LFATCAATISVVSESRSLPFERSNIESIPPYSIMGLV
jgi:hypothetical protein